MDSNPPSRKNPTRRLKRRSSASSSGLGWAALQTQEIGYDGNFTLSPVGDLDMALKLTLPMDRYQMLRNNVSNLYLLMRGLASNRAVFSNLDEAKKIVYFNESATNQMGTIRGNSRLQLPARATQAKYDASRKLVTYVMPKGSSGSMRSALLLPVAVLLILGLGAFGASFLVGRKTGARPVL